MPHEEWYDLLSTMEAKCNRKISADQIKRLAASKSAPANSDIYAPARGTRKKKARNGVVTVHKNQGKKFLKHSGAQLYCVLYKKSVMP